MHSRLNGYPGRPWQWIGAKNGDNILTELTRKNSGGLLPAHKRDLFYTRQPLHLFRCASGSIIVHGVTEKNLKFNPPAKFLDHIIKTEGNRTEQAKKDKRKKADGHSDGSGQFRSSDAGKPLFEDKRE